MGTINEAVMSEARAQQDQLAKELCIAMERQAKRFGREATDTESPNKQPNWMVLPSVLWHCVFNFLAAPKDW